MPGRIPTTLKIKSTQKTCLVCLLDSLGLRVGKKKKPKNLPDHKGGAGSLVTRPVCSLAIPPAVGHLATDTLAAPAGYLPKN